MSLKANESKNTGSKGVIQPIEPATYPARLVMVVDLGKQAQRPFKGKDKQPAYEILTMYEFVDEFLKNEAGEDQKDKPRWISERFPLYSLTAEKAKSTARYNALDPVNEFKGDWGKLLDKPVLVTTVNNPKQGGGVYTNIAAVVPMRTKEAATCPPLVHKPTYFDLDAPTVEVFTALPQWVQKAIMGNLEFAGSKLERLLATTTKEVNQPDEAPSASESIGDENPY